MALARRTQRLGLIGRRVGWGLADQVFSSLTNFAVGIVIARSVGTEGFGAFSLAFVTYLVAMGASRALSTEPLLVRYSHTDLERWRTGTRQAAGMAALVGVCTGVGCVVVGLLLDGAVGDAFLALGVTLPGLLVQDSWRFAFFADRRGRSAFVNDAVWAALLLPLFALLTWRGDVSVLLATLAWGSTAGVAAAVGALQARLLPAPRTALAWLREHRDIAPGYLGEFLSLNGTKQLSLYGITAVAGLAAAGTYRAGQLLIGPIKVLFQGLTMVAVPEAVRLHARSVRRFVVWCCGLSGAQVTLALGVGGVTLLVPDRVGEALLAETWEPARAVLLPFALAAAGTGAVSGALVGLRVLEASRRSLRSRILASVLNLGFSIGGAVLGGVRLAAWGVAIALWIGAVNWWLEFRGALRDKAPRQDGSAATDNPTEHTVASEPVDAVAFP